MSRVVSDHSAIMEQHEPPGYDSYEAWLGSDEDIEDLWQTKNGETFAITETAVYLPDGIGPLDGEQRVAFSDLDGYDVDVEYLNNPVKPAIPLGFGAVCLLAGFFVGEGVRAILLAVGVLSLLAATIFVIQERNTVTAQTHITIEMGRFSETVTIDGDLGDEVGSFLEPHF